MSLSLDCPKITCNIPHLIYIFVFLAQEIYKGGGENTIIAEYILMATMKSCLSGSIQVFSSTTTSQVSQLQNSFPRVQVKMAILCCSGLSTAGRIIVLIVTDTSFLRIVRMTDDAQCCDPFAQTIHCNQ